MLHALPLLCAAAAGAADFDAWAAAHGRVYATAAERARRAANYAATLRDAERLAAENPLATFGATEYADWDEDEFSAILSDFPAVNETAPTAARFSAEEVAAAEAASVDWRDKGAVTAVKDQGHCGDCWAFSTIGNLEGQWALAGNPLTQFSEQELTSCIKTKSNNGCKGGWMNTAMDWVVTNGGINSEDAYPFTAGKGKQDACDTKKEAESVAKFTSTDMLQKDEGQILAYMTQNGPISVAMDAKSFKAYKSGVLTTCKGTKTNHALLIVGYGTSDSTPYWIIKNSWGAKFGENGYLRLQYGKNSCGLLGGRPCSIKV